MNSPADITATDIAAIATATAALLAALAQWSWLIGPRRNGHRGRLHEIEARLDASERALSRCIDRLHTTRRLWRTLGAPSAARKAGAPQQSPEPEGAQTDTSGTLSTESERQI
jgi:hypothetical protein